MPNRKWICAVACAGVFFFRCVAFASGHFNVDVWNVESENPPPENVIIALTQTHDGYLWLGTLNGLARFDGVSFTVFDENNTPGLNDVQTVHLFEDSQSNLWVGTRSDGVVLIRGGRAISVGVGRGGREGRLMDACEDSEGAVWLYTANGLLCRYKDGNGMVWQMPERESNCRSMVAEKSGSVWVGTDHLIYEINPKAQFGTNASPFTHGIFVTEGVDFLVSSAQGGYWRLADGRIQKWNGTEMQRDLGPYPWTNSVNPIKCACEDQNGGLVIGTDGDGVWLFDGEGKNPPENIKSEQGLSHNTILSLCVDREGSIWAGTDGRGLDRIKRQFFQVAPGTDGSTAQTVYPDAEGGVLFGILGGGVRHLKEGKVEQYGVGQKLRGGVYLTNLYVRSVFMDRSNQVWTAADYAGLFKINDGQFTRPAGFETIAPLISAIHESRDGELWLGTAGGLLVGTNEQWTAFTTHNSKLTSDSVTSIADDADGNLWAGTDGGGLNRFRDGQFTAFHKADGLPSEHISALFVDRDGVIWMGTASGLARFQNNHWTRYTENDGLGSDSVDYITEDTNDCLWVGSNAGLMRIPKRGLNDFAQGLTNFIACRTYAKPDGLPTRECTPGSQPATCQTRDGKLWFATISGLVFVNPADIKLNTNPPPVVIESVYVDGQMQNTNGIRAALPSLISVPADREQLEIQYTSLNLASADKARFRYRMEGHEKNWTDAGNGRIARYPRLPPGNYHFHVIACNEDGVWNEAGAMLAFYIEPPFWETWWFLGITVLVVLALIIGIVHYFSTQRLQRQLEGMRQQQALEKERSRIARDIHDQLGASMTQLSLLGEMVESDKNHPNEVEGHARQISQTARDTSHVLDEIVWTVNPSNDTLEGLINYICKYAQDYLAVAGLRYRLDVPAQLPAINISPELRHNVFLASKEAVTNVVRHAKATEVWLRMKIEPGQFTLEIQDNGRGPGDLSAKKTRNGLRNMHKRMEDVGGSFAMNPGPEGGTIVHLTAPINEG